MSEKTQFQLRLEQDIAMWKESEAAYAALGFTSTPAVIRNIISHLQGILSDLQQ